MTPDDLETRIRTWLAIPAGSTGPDADAAPVVADGVVSLVDRLPSAPRETDGSWSPTTILAATMLGARLVRRRNSPAGIEAFGADGATYVQRTDPDVASMLRIGPFATPRVG